jgi:hypothetical protein
MFSVLLQPALHFRGYSSIMPDGAGEGQGGGFLPQDAGTRFGSMRPIAQISCKTIIYR